MLSPSLEEKSMRPSVTETNEFDHDDVGDEMMLKIS